MDRPTLALAATMTVFCALAWTAIGKRLVAGLPLLTLEPRRPVPWRGVDLVLLGIFFLLASLACALVFSSFFSAGNPTAGEVAAGRPGAVAQAGELMVSLLANIAANLTTAAFALLWISSHSSAVPEDLGWRRDKMGEDLRLGLVTFVAVAAPVYGLQALLSQFIEEQHPIIEVLQQHPSPTLYALAGLSAVVIAPFAEEFFFRVLLQGWLESVRWPVDAPADETQPVAEHRPRPIAIVATSLLFAALHIGHGAAPVPLFFLALVLGYLYQRTHRLLPCATVHFCVNAFSFALLCLAPSQ
jgi:membrane protease YdiL (CAAX protease family)